MAPSMVSAAPIISVERMAIFEPFAAAVPSDMMPLTDHPMAYTLVITTQHDAQNWSTRGLDFSESAPVRAAAGDFDTMSVRAGSASEGVAGARRRQGNAVGQVQDRISAGNPGQQVFRRAERVFRAETRAEALCFVVCACNRLTSTPPSLPAGDGLSLGGVLSDSPLFAFGAYLDR